MAILAVRFILCPSWPIRRSMQNKSITPYPVGTRSELQRKLATLAELDVTHGLSDALSRPEPRTRAKFVAFLPHVLDTALVVFELVTKNTTKVADNLYSLRINTILDAILQTTNQHEAS